MNELGELFADKQHSLKLYCRLINKTTIAHEQPIQKHVDAFRTFCTTNREAILSKDSSKFIDTKVSYSPRVFVNIAIVFKDADSETSLVIWKHLLLISALVDPSGKAKEVLKNSSGQEADFLTNIIDKVEKNIDVNANPLQAVTSIMSSGIFNDLVGGMKDGLEDGSLNIGKLMGTVQGMISTLGEEKRGEEKRGEEKREEEEKEGDQTVYMINNMLGSMMGSMGNNEGGDNTAPPIDIMSMMGSMMGGGDNNNEQPNIMSMLGPMLTSLNTEKTESSSTKADIVELD